MKKILATREEKGFDWIDMTDPSEEELMQLADEYQLHTALVHDSLQRDHLPKYERVDDYAFIIFRIHVTEKVREADSIQQLTDKLAVFQSEDFIITIHHGAQSLIERCVEFLDSKRCNNNNQELLNYIVYSCLLTYEKPLNELTKDVDYYEREVFLGRKKAPFLKGLYHLKRKLDIIRQMFILSFEIIDMVDSKTGNVNTRETRDQYVKLQNLFESQATNVQHLLSIYFSVSAQRTNDTIRILTIFSVFFMPMTFIVGVYGMNFDFMPELHWKFGYPGVLLAMVVITLCIYSWFKRKGWL